jgi:hypothetical protein
MLAAARNLLDGLRLKQMLQWLGGTYVDGGRERDRTPNSGDEGMEREHRKHLNRLPPYLFQFPSRTGFGSD